MLKIVQALNNNVILAINDKDEEIVVLGNGIGFKRKKDDIISINSSMTIYQVKKDSRIEQILEGISIEMLDLVNDIIRNEEKFAEKQNSMSLLVAIADHLTFALERLERGLKINNPVRWEIPHLYPDEYELGLKTISKVNKVFKTDLPVSEASMVALHFVNAQYDMKNMNQIFEVISEIVKLIEKNFNIIIDKETAIYSRFITHIRYFIVRQQKDDASNIGMDKELKDVIQEKYSGSFACAYKVVKCLEDKYGWIVNEDELVYLTIHIERIVLENN